MEDTVIADAPFYTSNNPLVYQDDINGEEANQEKPQVSMSMGRPRSRLNQHNLLTVSLAVLAVILLVVDIGLGVHYNNLTAGQNIGSTMAGLQDAYLAALHGREDARKQLEKELSDQQHTKWEVEHVKKRTRDYEKLIEKYHLEVATLKSNILLLNEGCRMCPPRWIHISSMCYYLTTEENLTRRSWQEARTYCKRNGGDLAVLDNRETQLAVANLIQPHARQGQLYLSAFWIGLSDMEEEGTWKWTNGRRLTEGYWMNGEPNNQGNEDCAGLYPVLNPFKSWNDAPCGHSLRWICQMTVRDPGQT